MTLAVVPTYLARPGDVDLTTTCLRTLRDSEPDVEVLVVDDGSPVAGLVDEMELVIGELQMELHRKDKNTGFSRTVNVGLGRAAEEGKDAVLVNADIEFSANGWLAAMEAQEYRDEPAAIVGALLLYPNGLIQHAGIFFSLLHRVFEHRYRYAPYDLPEAQTPFRCPVTGALQFIRHSALAEVGLYDENFLLGWEDVDYALRVFQAGGHGIYQPKVRAYHHESMFRGRPSPKIEDWTLKSKLYFDRKWAGVSMSQYLPTWI